MNTDIEYLRQLEIDLKDAAVREAARVERVALQGSIRRNTGRTWMRVSGAAAAFLLVAGAIGFLATSGSGEDTGTVPGQARRAVGFQGVGDAVGSGGGSDGGAMASPAPAAGPADLGYGEAPEAGTIKDLFEDQPAFIENLEGRPTSGVGGRAQSQQDLSKIVRDGRIGIVVADGRFSDSVGDLTVIAERSGGFILSSSTNNERSGTFILRIPERSFDRVRNEIRNLGVRVRFEEVRGDDVTAEFIDFTARLRILQTRKTLLNSLLVGADTTDEILRLSGQVEDVQLRIEQMQGQLRFLNDQVAESTLRVTIQEQGAPAAVKQTDVDNPDLGSSFDLGVQGFLRIVGAVMIGLGYLIPITAIAGIVWMAVWFVRRRRATA